MILKLIAKGDSRGFVTCHNVKVVNAATGEEVEGIVSCSFHANVEDLAILKLEVVCLEAEIESEAEIVKVDTAGPDADRDPETWRDRPGQF